MDHRKEGKSKRSFWNDYAYSSVAGIGTALHQALEHNKYGKQNAIGNLNTNAEGNSKNSEQNTLNVVQNSTMYDDSNSNNSDDESMENDDTGDGNNDEDFRQPPLVVRTHKYKTYKWAV